MNMAINKKRLFTKAAGAVGHQSLRLDIFLLSHFEMQSGFKPWNKSLTK